FTEHVSYLQMDPLGDGVDATKHAFRIPIHLPASGLGAGAWIHDASKEPLAIARSSATQTFQPRIPASYRTTLLHLEMKDHHEDGDVTWQKVGRIPSATEFLVRRSVRAPELQKDANGHL